MPNIVWETSLKKSWWNLPQNLLAPQVRPREPWLGSPKAILPRNPYYGCKTPKLLLLRNSWKWSSFEKRKAQKGGGAATKRNLSVKVVIQKTWRFQQRHYPPSSHRATSAPAMLHSKVTPSCGGPTVGPSATLISTAPRLESSPSPIFLGLFFFGPLKVSQGGVVGSFLCIHVRILSTRLCFWSNRTKRKLVMIGRRQVKPSLSLWRPVPTSRSHPLQIFLGSIDPCGKTQTNPPEMCLI